MRLAELRVGACIALLLGIALSGGCGGGGSPTSPNVKVDPSKKEGDPAKKAGIVEPAKESTAAEFAKNALAAIEKGTLTPESFSPDFLKVLARPLSDDDRKLGYNPVAARAWLERQIPAAVHIRTQSVFGAVDGAPGPGSAYVTGHVAGAKPGIFGLAVVGAGGKYKIAWLYRSTVTASSLPNATAHGAAETATAFLDSLIGGEIPIAEALMTTSLKAAHAEPFASETEIGYNAAKVRNVVLAGWKADHTGYKVSKYDASGGKLVTVYGELTGPGPAKPFVLTLSHDANFPAGAWLVSNFKIG